MTTIWGPLGWMTLHSISCCYPEVATPADKAILTRFLEKFRETITCPHCKNHFSGMFQRYSQTHPEWANGRTDLFLFICRAHNTVNRRLDKPKYGTVTECLDVLQKTTKITSPSAYRNAYLAYLLRNWGREMSGEGFMMSAAVREMIKINEEYWNPRDIAFDAVHIPEANLLEFIPENVANHMVARGIPPMVPGNPIPKVGFKLRGGRVSIV